MMSSVSFFSSEVEDFIKALRCPVELTPLSYKPASVYA